MDFLSNLENYLHYDLGLSWPVIMRIEDAFTTFGWFILGIAIASYIWASLMVRAKENWEKYREHLKDNDFAALRLTDLDGKATFLINGRTTIEILSAVLSYFIIFFFPKRYSLWRNRKNMRRILYFLWVISGILAIIGILLTIHITKEIP